MRLRAKVNEANGNVKNYLGGVNSDKATFAAEIPSPVAVEIALDEGAYYLLRLDSDGGCLADTWHKTLDEAKEQAKFEFGVAPDEWTKIS